MAKLRYLLATLNGLLFGLLAGHGTPLRAQTPDVLAFEQARAINTQAAYQDFIAQFPDSPLVSEAFRAIIDLALIAPLPGAESPTRSLGAGSDVAAALY